MKGPTWNWVAAGVRALAPIALTACGGAFTIIIWRGGWPLETAAQRIDYLGVALILTVLLLGLALGLLSVVRTFTFKAPGIEASVNEAQKVDELPPTAPETEARP